MAEILWLDIAPFWFNYVTILQLSKLVFFSSNQIWMQLSLLSSPAYPTKGPRRAGAFSPPSWWGAVMFPPNKNSPVETDLGVFTGVVAADRQGPAADERSGIPP